MTESNEFMDTGALTEDAVPSEESTVSPDPAPAGAEPDLPTEPDVIPEPSPQTWQPTVEAPGSPSSDADQFATTEESDGSEGPDATLPKGAKMYESNEEAAQDTVAGNPPGDPTLPVGNAEQQQ